jgi:hypothetical protein
MAAAAGGGADQVNLVERWQAGEVIGDPAIVQLFTEHVLKVRGLFCSYSYVVALCCARLINRLFVVCSRLATRR